MDFHDLTNIDIDDPVMATIGGMVFRLFGRLPAVGDQVQHEGYDFSVLKMDRLRISQLRVSKSVQPKEEDGGGWTDHGSEVFEAVADGGLAALPDYTEVSVDDTRSGNAEEPK